MPSPFADALRPLKDRFDAEQRARVEAYRRNREEPKPPDKQSVAFQHHPDNHSLYAFNGNEQPNLGQLVDQLPPEGGMEAYIRDMEKS